MNRQRPRSAVASGLVTGLLLATAMTVRADPGRYPAPGGLAARAVAEGAGGSQRLGAPAPTSPSHRSPSSAATEALSFRTATVDTRPYTGFENAIYAASRRTLYVAYKRFLRNPFDPGGDVVAAQLR